MIPTRVGATRCSLPRRREPEGGFDWRAITNLCSPPVSIGQHSPRILVQASLRARIMTTLLNELERSGGRYGLQTMCEGGGLANATIIENLAA